MTDHPSQLHAFLETLFAHGPFWVYAAIGLACFIENIFPPFPGDTFLVAVGNLSLPATVLVIVGSGMTSVMLLYAFGRSYGRTFILRKNYRYFSAADVSRMEERLRKWGTVVLLASRFIVGFRSAVAVAAGIGQYPRGKMFVYSLVSYLMFCLVLLWGAAAVVNNYETIAEFISAYNRVVWPLLAAVIAWFIYRRSRKLKGK